LEETQRRHVEIQRGIPGPVVKSWFLNQHAKRMQEQDHLTAAGRDRSIGGTPCRCRSTLPNTPSMQKSNLCFLYGRTAVAEIWNFFPFTNFFFAEINFSKAIFLFRRFAEAQM
jgi:hypothetical protein